MYSHGQWSEKPDNDQTQIITQNGLYKSPCSLQPFPPSDTSLQSLLTKESGLIKLKMPEQSIWEQQFSTRTADSISVKSPNLESAPLQTSELPNS